MSNTTLSNLPNLQNTELKRKIYQAEGDEKNHVDISYEDIDDRTITQLIRMGFSISYSGIFVMYRIRW